jgi:hypothetical protein
MVAIADADLDLAYRSARDAAHFAILYLVVDIVGALAFESCPDCSPEAQGCPTDGLCRCGRFSFGGAWRWSIDPPGMSCAFCHSAGFQVAYSDVAGQFIDPGAEEVYLSTLAEQAAMGIRTISAPCPVCGCRETRS